MLKGAIVIRQNSDLHNSNNFLWSHLLELTNNSLCQQSSSFNHSGYVCIPIVGTKKFCEHVKVQKGSVRVLFSVRVC